MIKPLDVFLVAAMIGGAIWTYQIKHDSELSAEKIVDLRTKISEQREKIVLLEADWALLNNPARLLALSETFEEDLQLMPMESTQIATLSELPPMREAPLGDTDVMADGVDTRILTGSIPRGVPKPRPAGKHGSGIGDLIEKEDR